MSYTDYLRRMAINTPKVIDTQLRLPDASSYTWRKKLESTRINRRTDHVINNSQDTPAPRLFSPSVQGYAGSGFGGRVQDASSYTLSLGAHGIGKDTFRAENGTRRIQTNPINTSGKCLTHPPASQVVSELGNSDGSVAGLNMGYVTTCNDGFHPQAKSYFVDTIPELKTRKIGVQSRDPHDNLGRQIVQNPITTCITTNTGGVTVDQLKAHVPFNSYSAVPKNSIGSGANIVHRTFVTSPTGPQTGGGNTPGSRAPIVGGVSIKPKGSITHRGWANPSRNPYPGPRVPPTGAPAQKKINDPNHYKV